MIVHIKIIMYPLVSYITVALFLGLGSSLHAQQQPHVIMHIGLHKTGSSAIQTLSRNLFQELMNDGYEMPWNKTLNDAELNLKPGQELLIENQANFASCFMPDTFVVRENYPCIPDLLHAGHTIAASDQGIFLTSEEFDNIYFNIPLFKKDYLEKLPYNNTRIRVIAVYRRYYDFLQSAHNELTKEKILMILESPDQTLNAEKLGWHEWTIVDVINGDQLEHFRFIEEAIQRYKDAFENYGESDVIVINYHENKENLMEKFFCEAMPFCTNTCNAVRSRQIEKGSLIVNQSKDLAPYFIAYHAFKKGLLDIKNSGQVSHVLQEIDKYIMEHPRSIKMINPTRDSLNLLLKHSLHFERKYLGEDHFKGPNGAADLRRDFNKRSITKFGTVDIESLLSSSEWQLFFEGLNEYLDNDNKI